MAEMGERMIKGMIRLGEATLDIEIPAEINLLELCQILRVILSNQGRIPNEEMIGQIRNSNFQLRSTDKWTELALSDGFVLEMRTKNEKDRKNEKRDKVDE